jgi:glycerophosphoryl diester phosphodiesterase
MLELDCHITKDEQVVVSHDANLKRSTGVNVNVSDLKYCVSKKKLISLYLKEMLLRQKRARCHS